MNKYNQRVRESISDLLVSYSKEKQERLRELWIVQTRLDNEDGKLTYTDYVDLTNKKETLQNKINELEIRLDCLDMVRELCLNIADTVFNEKD